MRDMQVMLDSTKHFGLVGPSVVMVFTHQGQNTDASVKALSCAPALIWQPFAELHLSSTYTRISMTPVNRTYYTRNTRTGGREKDIDVEMSVLADVLHNVHGEKCRFNVQSVRWAAHAGHVRISSPFRSFLLAWSPTRLLPLGSYPL